MSQDSIIPKFLLAIFLIVVVAILAYQFATASYDVLSVTPLFFMSLANHLMPLTILSSFIGLLASLAIKSRMLFMLSSLAMYLVVLYIPYTTFPLYVYNDQLGFALEALSGYVSGFIVPYQGEYTTLGHAYFTTIAGKVLGLNLFQATRLVETVFVFASFIVCFTLAFPLFERYRNGKTSLPLAFFSIVILTTFPAFILEPLLYSRGYFGLVVSMFLILCMFKFLEKIDVRTTILTTVTFVASSISYPLGPFMVIISMAFFIVLLKLLALTRKDVSRPYSIFLAKLATFFVIWSAIQVYLGYGVWGILHEIILNLLRQEYFTAFKVSIALNYVGDAATYVTLRLMMIIAGWLISAFIALAFMLKFLKNKSVPRCELFAFSLISMFGMFGAIHGVLSHEPALRFYRSLVSILPFALALTANNIAVKKFSGKTILAFLFVATFVFLMLSPITKWGWTFVAYPTERDIALSNFIISHHEAFSNRVFYAPGSHELLWFHFESVNIPSKSSEPRVLGGDDINFDLNEAALADYTATYYIMFIYSRWLGEDICVTINKMQQFASTNDLLYNNGGLWLLVRNVNI